MITRSKFTTLGLAAALVTTLAGTTLSAQPDRGDLPGRPGDQPAERGQPEADRPLQQQISPERFRERLVDLQAQLQESSERLAGAIATLDNGGSVEDVVEQLGGPLRVRRLAEMWSQWGRAGSGLGNRGGDRPGMRMGGGPGGPPGMDGPADEGAEGHPWATRQATPDEVLAFLREHAPTLAERLGQLREDDPQRAEGMLMRIEPRVSEVLSAQEHDPELGELMARDFTLGIRFIDAARQYMKARATGDSAAVEDAKSALRELAGEQVDLRLARREHELKMLVQRIKSMQDEVEQQRNDREKLIDDMVEQVGQGRFRGGPDGDRPGRGGPPEGPGRRERHGAGGNGGGESGGG